MHAIVKYVLLAALLLLIVAIPSQAQTINATSCSSGDVQAAFNAANNSTVTINIPAGVCHWSSHVAFNVPSGNTSLTILGAGTCTGTPSPTSCNDATTIIDDDTTDSTWLLQINTGTAPSYLRVSGITLQGGMGTAKWNAIFAINGYTQHLRIDHIHLNGNTYTSSLFPAIRVTNWIYGVIDHSIFEGPHAAGLQVWMDNYGSSAYSFGDGSWADEPNFGSEKFIFVENNTFITTANTGGGYFYSDCSAGGRFVTRYNTFTSTGLLNHPTGGAGRMRGCRALEIYGNSFGGTVPDFAVFYDQSGTSLIWNNTINSSYSNFLNFHNTRADNSIYSEAASPKGWGYCGTLFNGTSSVWDQNTSSNGYACLDQVGRGKGDLLKSDFPNVLDTATKSGTWPNQAVEPVYEWMNNYAGLHYVSTYPTGTTIFQANRDYYLWCNSSSSSGCSTFTGATGTGSGLLAARPSSCTAGPGGNTPGVAYWATDTNTLYVCSSTNTWTTYYTPYTYPHPLTQGSQSSYVAAPTGLVANVQ